MAPNQKYTVEGRQFSTETEYRRALRDLAVIKKLRPKVTDGSDSELLQVKQLLKSKKLKFNTVLGQDFEDEVDREIKRRQESKNMDKFVGRELKKRERRRRLIIAGCSIAAVGCFIYLGLYSYFLNRTSDSYDEYAKLKEKAKENAGEGNQAASNIQVMIHYDDDDGETPDVLEEYVNLLNINKKLIGWVKIDDTNIDYPVMQTLDNEYYLTHNLQQEYDINGSIFMDMNCDVLKPSTNFILYGHHMKNGKMFGSLDKYKDKKYWEKHRYILFDTIYEHGKYEIMYAFNASVLSEGDVEFKYYQFIDAYSPTEFESYMEEMAGMSLYDTGVTAAYGDHLLTLSTCDESVQNGRFVVVARKMEGNTNLE